MCCRKKLDKTEADFDLITHADLSSFIKDINTMMRSLPLSTTPHIMAYLAKDGLPITSKQEVMEKWFKQSFLDAKI